MKRSEALEIVREHVNACVGGQAFGCEESISEHILKGLEVAGMQPPEIKAIFLLTKQDGTKQNSFSMVNRWEPEND